MAKRKPPQQPQRQRIAEATVRAACEEAVRQIGARDRRATLGELLPALARAGIRPDDPLRRSLFLELVKIERSAVAAPGEDFGAARRRILLECGASTRMVAALEAVKVNDSGPLQAAKRAKRKRVEDLKAELADIDGEIDWRAQHGVTIGAADIRTRRDVAQAALDRLSIK